MAAGSWTEFDTFKKNVVTGTIDLNTDTFQVILMKGSWSTAETSSASTYGELGASQVNSNAAYTRGTGVTLPAMTVSVSGNNAVWATSGSDIYFSATTSAIQSIQYAVIVKNEAGSVLQSTDKLVAYVQLSTSQFSVAATNSLTIDLTNDIFDIT